MKPILALVIADTHYNDFGAVSAPRLAVEGGKRWIDASWIQSWLYDLWLGDVEYVKQRAVGKDLVVIHLGDGVEGDHQDAITHVMDTNDQVRNFVDFYKPVVNLAVETWWTYGTPEHAGPDARYEKQICQELGIRNHDYHFRLNLGDDRILDIAHQGPASSEAMIKKAIEDCTKDRTPLPRYVARGHRHVIVDSGEKYPMIRAFTCPCWQLRTGYGWKVASLSRSDLGMVLIEGEHVEFRRHIPQPAPVRDACAH